MLNYQLDFDIEDGNINTFLIGSKQLFESVDKIIDLISKSLDLTYSFDHKLIELENNKISYKLNLDITYPLQNGFGLKLEKDQINSWFTKSLKIILNDTANTKVVNNLNQLAKDINIDQNFIYVEIPLNIFTKTLEDLKNLSILLFIKLTFIEK